VQRPGTRKETDGASDTSEGDVRPDFTAGSSSASDVGAGDARETDAAAVAVRAAGKAKAQAHALKTELTATKNQLREVKDQLKQARMSESQWREECFKLAGHFTPYVAVRANGALYLVNTSDTHIGQDLFVKRNRKEMRTLARALTAHHQLTGIDERGVFIDVGANIGTTAVDAIVSHRFASAFAFEPEPENFRTLSLNVALNDLQDRVTLVRAGLSNRDGTASLDVSSPGSSKHWIVDPAHPVDRSTVPVSLTRLDTVIESGALDATAVSFLWMDVEGHEGHVLAGAGHVLERGVPFVMEFCPRHFQRAGRLEDVEDAVRANYTHLLDLRKPWPEGTPPFIQAADIGAIADEYGDTGFTDVLACSVR
jgi:FkbM family methyltransferase